MCSAFHPLRTNPNIPESNIGSTVDGSHAGERKECTVCCGRTLADFVPGCVQCDKTLNFGLCSRCAPGFYLNEVDWDDIWALLWSDILTFSRSLKMTKKTRSTHLKRYFYTAKVRL